MREFVPKRGFRIARSRIGSVPVHDDPSLIEQCYRGAPLREPDADPLSERGIIRRDHDNRRLGRTWKTWKSVSLRSIGQEIASEAHIAGHRYERETASCYDLGARRYCRLLGV